MTKQNDPLRAALEEIRDRFDCENQFGAQDCRGPEGMIRDDWCPRCIAADALKRSTPHPDEMLAA